MATIAINNGLKTCPVAHLTDAQVHDAVTLYAESMDDEIREHLHVSDPWESERAFLEAYCAAHARAHGEPWTLP